MRDIQRWDPGETGLIRNWVGRFVDDPRFMFPERVFGQDFGRSVLPAFDVYETEHDVVVNAELPGFKPGDVDITVYADRLSVSGKMHDRTEEKGASFLRRERRSGSFERTISLPADVDRDNADASFRDGILEIRIPKIEDAKKSGRKLRLDTADRQK